MRIVNIIFLSFLFFAASSCSSQKLAYNAPSTGSTAYSGPEEEEIRIIRTQEDLDQLVKEYYLKSSPALEGIDLKHHNLIFLSAGMRTSGGYSISIENIEKKGQDLTLHYTETKPGNNCMRTDAITYPYTVVNLPKGETFKSASAVRTEKVIDCDS